MVCEMDILAFIRNNYCICLKGRVAEKEGEADLYLLVPPKGHNPWGLVTLKAGDENSVHVSHMAGRSPKTLAVFFFFFLFSQLHFLAWQVEQLGFQPVLVDAGGIPGSGLTCHVTALALID